jgi:ribonuclease Z
VDKDNTSFLIRHNAYVILIDCPGSIVQKAKKLDVEPASIRTLIVTHTHPDHVYGLPSLIHSLMLTECQIDLFGSEISIDFCRRFLDLFHLLDTKVKCRVRFFPLDAGHEFFVADSIACSTQKVPHNESSLAFGFRFGPSGSFLFYSGDTPIHPPLFESIAGADYLIHDCSAPSRLFEQFPALKAMHTNSLDLGKYAQKAGINCLIPCHFFGELSYSFTEIEQEIRTNYSGKLIVPEDFMRLIL